jgi:DNA-binding ferritin-like protein
MEMVGRLIGTMFLAREYAHRAHLSVTGVGSFAKHSALGEFYKTIIKQADGITEAYQGRHDTIIEIPYLPMIDEEDPAKALESLMDDIEKLRYDAVDKKDTPIQNLIDGAIETFLSTLYKLRKLR